MFRTLKFGDRGEDVTRWQTTLNVFAGAYPHTGISHVASVDGHYAESTKIATEQLERFLHLPVTGTRGMHLQLKADAYRMLHPLHAPSIHPHPTPTPVPAPAPPPRPAPAPPPKPHPKTPPHKPHSWVANTQPPFRMIDVSNWDGAVDWGGIARRVPKVVAVYAKCTQGLGFVDATYNQNRSGCLSHHIFFGAYHFFEACSSDSQAVAQAEFVMLHAGAWQEGTMKIALDYGETPVDADPQQAVYANVFCDHILRRRGYVPVEYGAPSLMPANLDARGQLWLALSNTPQRPWSTVAIEQGAAHADGLPGDVDISHTAIAHLLAPRY